MRDIWIVYRGPHEKGWNPRGWKGEITVSYPHILKSRERKALQKLSFEREKYLIPGQLPGIGETTMANLVKLGLVEVGESKRYPGCMGWKITADGWRCMYGKTYEEIMSAGVPARELRVWQWPLA